MFNLKEALGGATVVTRAGHSVNHLTMIPGINSGESLVGVVGGELVSWYVNGHYYSHGTESLYDLQMTQRVGDYVMNIFEGETFHNTVTKVLYPSRILAELAVSDDVRELIDIISIDFKV